MAKIEKISKETLLSMLRVGERILNPLVIRRLDRGGPSSETGDATLDLEWEGSSNEGDADSWRFSLICRTLSTPKAVMVATAEVKKIVQKNTFLNPMILVPYLNRDRLSELQKEGVSGIDSSGNGIVVVPGKLFVLCTGEPNRNPSSQPLGNPYQGRSALVGRTLLSKKNHKSLGELADEIGRGGETISLSQVSKAVAAMSEDLIVGKTAGSIGLLDPMALLDKLGKAWTTDTRRRRYLRIGKGSEWWKSLSAATDLKWAVTGESSAGRYVSFTQGGPVRIAVNRLDQAREAIGDAGKDETIPSFADLELFEVGDPGYFFANESDATGIRWASKLQTWLELQSGDARQRDASRDLKSQIIQGI